MCNTHHANFCLLKQLLDCSSASNLMANLSAKKVGYQCDWDRQDYPIEHYCSTDAAQPEDASTMSRVEQEHGFSSPYRPKALL